MNTASILAGDTSKSETRQRLEALAQLIVSSPDQKGLSNIGPLTLEELDHHGIGLLASELGHLPREISQQLNGRKALMIANDALKKHALQSLFDQFEESGLSSFVLLKGAALAYTIYPKPWLRPRTDTDLIINFSERENFRSVLHNAGFQRLPSIDGQLVSYQEMHSKQLTPGCVLNIDLHWKISNRQVFAESLTTAELLKASQPLSVFSNKVRISSPVLNVLMACQHRVGHHYDDERLIWLYDIHLLLSRFNDEEWQTLTEMAITKELAAITKDALQLVKRLFQTPISTEAMTMLHVAGARNEPSKWFLESGKGEWSLFWLEINSIKGVHRKLRFLFENLFPSSHYVRQRMETNNLLLAHGRRIWRGLSRLARIKRG